MMLLVPSNVEGRDFMLLLLLYQPDLFELAKIATLEWHRSDACAAVVLLHSWLCVLRTTCTRLRVERDPQPSMEAD